MQCKAIKASKLIATLPILWLSGTASAHTSQQSFVLLLPTDIYIGAGVAAVAATILIIALLPHRFSTHLFNPYALTATHAAPVHTSPHIGKSGFSIVTSLLALATLISILIIGFTGPLDPLKNLLPLTIWTVWWIGLVCLQGLIGNLWNWINPWTGVYFIFNRLFEARLSNWHLPESLNVRLGVWPGVIIYIVFSCFALADPAPEDPLRLAVVVSAYFMFTLIGMLLFGAQQWLTRCECFTMLLQRMADLAAVSVNNSSVNIGLPGWRLLRTPPSLSTTHTISTAVFCLTLLAAGSFDGLNETFWWLAKIGINPLEFPGRSAVIGQTMSGLLISITLLVAVYAICIWLGVRIANNNSEKPVPFIDAFTQLSTAILPIALAYHFAHFLTYFLVNIQYTIAALTDPLQNGRDLLGLGRFYVTTGFFNTRNTVEVIWLTQAAAVVAGHIFSVLIAHNVAARLWRQPKQALLSQLPLAVFMIFYTFLGLWLLAAPRGA